MLRQQAQVARKRALRWLSTPPPSHFADANAPPQTFSTRQSQASSPQHHQQQSPSLPPSQPQPQQQQQQQSQQSQPQAPARFAQNSERNGFLKEITGLLAMGALAYIAVDNYVNRVKLEKLTQEATAINLKTLQLQQQNFLNARKKRDLQVLQERREHSRRAFKMGLHIALLRRQLKEAGVDPIEIDNAVKEFEKNVKIDNSVKNVSGQVLWLEDQSRM